MPLQTEAVLFEEEQSFRQPWVWAVLLGSFVVVLAVCVAALLQGAGGAAVAAMAGGVALQVGTIWLLYVMKLAVRLDEAGLHVRFWPFVRKDIPLDEIARWEARTYRPIVEYGGWGVRCGWNGMADNVSGNRGVQLEFASGKRLLIGSQRADELAEAITRARQAR